MLSTLLLLWVAVVGWVCHTLCYAVWNAYFGSLCGVPGPKLAASTRFVIIFHKLRGDAESWRMKLHRTHGDVVRIAPNEISVASGTAWREIYGFAPNSSLARCDKDPMFYQDGSPSPHLVFAKDPDHGRMRKCFVPAFSEKALREQEPLIQGYISQLLSNIEGISDSDCKQTAQSSTRLRQIDLARQYNFTTFDIMGDFAFGEPLGCLANSDYIPWVSAIFASVKFLSLIAEINFYPRIKSLLAKMIPPSLNGKMKQHLEFAANRVDKRLSMETSRPDVWHHVLTKENQGLTRGEMHSNAALFMIAGSETSATTLSALTYYLLANPDTMDSCVQEIRKQFTSPDQINGRSVSSLKYLQACIDEAMRMHPPVPIGLPRIVPKSGLDVCGHKIPEGTSIYIHNLATCRSPRNFTRPDTFLPQRWLSDTEKTNNQSSSSSIFARDKKFCLQPFGVGPRNCIGQSLAQLELRLIVTQVLWHFDLELCPESRGWDDQRVFHLWESKPLMVTAKAVVR